MDNLLIAYSTTDNHTQTICERIRRVVEEQGQSVVMTTIDDAMKMDLESFNKIVIGASIRYGKHRPQVHEFVRKNQSCLESRPSAFFSVNLVARKPEKSDPEANPYMQKFLQQISWQPQTLAVLVHVAELGGALGARDADSGFLGRLGKKVRGRFRGHLSERIL